MNFYLSLTFDLLKKIEISNRTISSNIISAKTLILFNTFFQLRHNICILWSQKISSQSWMIISLDFHFCGSTVNTRFINKTNFVWMQFIRKVNFAWLSVNELLPFICIFAFHAKKRKSTLSNIQNCKEYREKHYSMKVRLCVLYIYIHRGQNF